jgi:hypothetical protein
LFSFGKAGINQSIVKDLLPPVIAVREVDLLITTVVLKGERLIPISGIRKGNAYARYQNGIPS